MSIKMLKRKKSENKELKSKHKITVCEKTRPIKREIAIFLMINFLLALCIPMQTIAGADIYIDTVRIYDGMESSFSQGYEPAIKDDTMYLVVPFAAEKELLNDRILVGISFVKDENCPFYYRNYQKQVKKSEDGIYLYQCEIKLKNDRVNGQYPLKLSVRAQTGEEILQQEFTIYVEITDGKTKVSAECPPETDTPKMPVGETNGIKDDSNQSEKDEINNNASESHHNETSGADEAIQDESIQNSENGTADMIQESTASEDGQSGTEPEVMHQPRILLTSSLSENTLKAGETALWTVTVRNCSSSQSIENMKVTLISESNDISFEKNSWYFARTGAGKTIDLSQNISVEKKTAAEPVSVQFQFEYEDSKGNSYSSSETVKLSISQIQQAELTNLSFPESVYAADTESLTFQIHNTGLAELYNVRVRLEGTGLFPTQEQFLGNLEAGISVNGEIPVFAGTLDMNENGEISSEGAEKYGETYGKVIFSYENENGEVTEQTLDIHTKIKKPKTVELKVEKEQPKTNQWWITIVVGIVLVLVLVVIWLFLRMQYFKKRVEYHEKS